MAELVMDIPSIAGECTTKTSTLDLTGKISVTSMSFSNEIELEITTTNATRTMHTVKIGDIELNRPFDLASVPLVNAMITGFNPADMYAADHIRRVLTTFPGVFSGIGEFTIHKEFVSPKVAGDVASTNDPALDRILDFAAEAGLVVILHSDIDMPFAKVDTEPVYLSQMKALLKRHPKTTIIWAHMGLGRVVHPVQTSAAAAERSPAQVGIVEAMVTDPALAHVSFDISWDEVGKYAVASPESIKRVAEMLNRHPDRFLFGTDTVAPAGPAPYFAVFDMWQPVWSLLTPDASLKVRKGNYERIFNAGRTRVRAWEKANVR